MDNGGKGLQFVALILLLQRDILNFEYKKQHSLEKSTVKIDSSQQQGIIVHNIINSRFS